LLGSAKGGQHVPSTAPDIKLTRDELDDRRLAVENTVGTMRIEGMEPDETIMQILNSYQQGKIPIEEASRLMHEYSTTIL
jgi:hypothetical protein